jgi:ferredoxin
MKKLAVSQGNSKPGMVPTGTDNPVTPPGSIDFNHFTKNCIACYLCVGACPTNVIVPSFFDYGLEGFMQPKLDFHKNFCNFDCVRCTEVCPTGAITKQTKESKQEIQIGVARFIRKSCIVRVDRTDCGACSEHCPTKAVSMVPFGNGLSIPEVDPDLCIGCGACEFACPTKPYKAIYVESNLTHQKARRIEEGTGPREVKMDDFPF